MTWNRELKKVLSTFELGTRYIGVDHKFDQRDSQTLLTGLKTEELSSPCQRRVFESLTSE